ncbi:Riboflavin-binding protein [Diplonema papillatum]|nr:Riboflavin-binding protein [Diplonema papillatum]
MRTLPALCAMLAGSCVLAEPQCKTFAEIYGGGKALCENMWDEAFVYTEEGPAYTMWFYGENPNVNVTKAIHASGTKQLYGYDEHNGHEYCLNYSHKSAPSEEPDMTECNAWQHDSCCYASVAKSAKALNEAYGKAYHWDRCGKLSSGCERFFVAEACMYECEPAAALFAKFPSHPDAENDPNYFHGTDGANAWQIHGMPIEASFCDAWYQACKNDLFCSSDEGSYFTCAKEYETSIDASSSDDDGLPAVWLIVVIAVTVVAVGGITFLVYLIIMEKKGKPVYYAVPRIPPAEPTSEMASSPSETHQRGY